MSREEYLTEVIRRACPMLAGAVANEDFGRITEIRLELEAVLEGAPSPYGLMPEPQVEVEG